MAATASVNIMNEPIDPPTAPEPIRSSSYTHKLLEKYYSTVTTLRELLPPESGDDDGFDDLGSLRRLVGETVVASRAPAGPPRLDATSLGQGANGASMPEVSPPPLSSPGRRIVLSQLADSPASLSFCADHRAGTAALVCSARKGVLPREESRQRCVRDAEKHARVWLPTRTSPLLCSLSRRCPSCSFFASLDPIVVDSRTRSERGICNGRGASSSKVSSRCSPIRSLRRSSRPATGTSSPVGELDFLLQAPILPLMTSCAPRRVQDRPRLAHRTLLLSRHGPLPPPPQRLPHANLRNARR